MVLDGERHVIAQQPEKFEILGIVSTLVTMAAQRNHSHELSCDFQRDDAFEQLGSNVAVGAEEFVGVSAAENLRAVRGGERVNVFGEERNDRRIGEHGEARRGHRVQQGRFRAEGEKRCFTRARRGEQGGYHCGRGLFETSLGREAGTEVRKRLEGEEQPPKIVFFQRHEARATLNLYKSGPEYHEEMWTRRARCWLVWCANSTRTAYLVSRKSAGARRNF